MATQRAHIGERTGRSWQGPGMSVQEDFLQLSLVTKKSTKGNFQEVGGAGLEKRPREGTSKIYCLYLPGKLARRHWESCEALS